MNRRSTPLLAASLLLATFAFAPLAHADTLPINDCTTGAGTSCSTAGPQFDQDGICVATTCPSGSGGSFPCVLCELVDGGPAPVDAAVPDSEAPDATVNDAATTDASTPDASAPDAATNGGDPSTSLASSSTSCAMSPTAFASSPSSAWLLGLASLGVLGFAASRRRKA